MASQHGFHLVAAIRDGIDSFLRCSYDTKAFCRCNSLNYGKTYIH